ncbi:MAG: hypothetical protein ABW212_19210 [Pseudonocardia sediminis]
MLKKVGIVAATVTAGLLAVSPLAFAGDKGGESGGHHRGGADQVNFSDSSRNSSQNGLVNVGDVNALNNVALCPPIDANVAVGILGVLAPTGNAADGTGAEGSCSAGDSLNQLNNK